MASINVRFRPPALPGREGTIYYQVVHGKRSCTLSSDCHVHVREWDSVRSAILIDKYSERKAELLSIRQQVRDDVERLGMIIRRLDNKGVAYRVSDVVAEYRHYAATCSLFGYMARRAEALRLNGKIRTSETYAAALNSFRKFRRGKDLMLDSLNSEVMEAYEAWHRQRGVSSNTISFYNRVLRAAYNRAVEDELIENRRPFRRVYTGVDKTVKRALPLSVIKQIRELDLSRAPCLDFARDMFIMSFMLRGMSFIDMSFLRKSDLVNGYIAYRRKKTGQRLVVKWTADMQALLDKYPQNKSQYLLPIIRNAGANELYAYRNAGYNINHNLKTIAGMLGLTIPLTLYVARHSWASAARTKGIPLSVISEGMGHDSETTTRIYLASLDTAAVDNANSMILSSI